MLAALQRDLREQLAIASDRDLGVGLGLEYASPRRGAADDALPLPDDSVDLVTCIAVIEHVERPDILLAESHRVLRPGGNLVVTTPSRQAKPVLELISLRLRLIDPAEILDHKRYYTPTTLRRDIEAAGFSREAVSVRRFELGLIVAVATA